MDFGLSDKVVLITGGDSGIGYATAEAMLGEGATVVLSDKSTENLGAAAKRLWKRGRIFPISADLTKPEDVARLQAHVIGSYGRLDVLVHAAGITGPTGIFHELTDAEWHQALNVDFMSAIRVVRAFISNMADHGWGRVVLIGSEDAVQPYPEELPYCAAKAAILNLAKGLSKTYAHQGVLVNAVSPAFIATPMTDAMMERRSKAAGVDFDEAVMQFLEEERPTLELRRRGRAEEVAATIVFLCSERASFINGANFRVDGGSVATV
jgi:NAD(P)-dependent dehydrogenase (short-subunit alcohol dehydrogenase family)